MLRRVGKSLMGYGLFGVHITVAGPALQTIGYVAVQLDFYAGGNGFEGVLIRRLTMALSL